jgi:RNA polymerase sigma-70 factor (ECF subfamily)
VQEEPDGALLQRFARGDREAFEALFRQFEREVYRWIVRIVREPAAAEDALVEAFWRAHRGHARFDPSRSFGAWMRRIATNVAIDQLNAARKRTWTEVAVRQVASGAAGIQGGAGVGAVDFELRDDISRAFASLPPTLRVVATLALIEEVPHLEIAEALGVPVGTVKSRLFRATRELRKELAGHDR